MPDAALSAEDRTKWRQLVVAKVYNFINAPKEARDDPAVCLEACKREGMMLEHCSPTIQAHKNICLQAVQNNAEAFIFTDESLRGDPEIVKTVVRERGQLLRYASEELRGDSELVLEVIHDLWFTAEYVADSLRFDPDFWREVIDQDPETGWMAFSYAPVEIRSDQAVVMEAIKVDPMAFKFASDELRNDKEFVLEAVKVNWITLKHASAALRRDPQVVLEALSQDFEALQYAAEELLAEPSFALEAAGFHGRALARGGLARHLQDNKDWVLDAVKKNPMALAYADDEYRVDRDVINASVGGRLGECSGLLWRIDQDSIKWAPGETVLAAQAMKAEDDEAEVAALEAAAVGSTETAADETRRQPAGAAAKVR